MITLPPALEPLTAFPQFVGWIAVRNEEKPGTFHKFPINVVTGSVIDAQDPAHWTDYTTAAAHAARWDRGHGGGVGFVFTDADPFYFLDIDKCLEPGPPAAWSPLALELLARLPGAAVEVSHSGRGLHVFGRYADLPEHAKKNTPLGLELYHNKRFVALTGTGATGWAGVDHTAQLALLCPQYFTPSPTGEFAGWTSEPAAEWSGPADDDDLIAKALKSGQRSAAVAFGGGDTITFKTLWTADVETLAKRWPGEGAKPFGQSEADQTLANHLAFWTGKNCERMERLMRASGLMREKWDTHRSYLGQTILKACGFVGKVATARAAPDPVVMPADPVALEATAAATGRSLRAGAEYMGAMEQLAHFAGCYFISDDAKIYVLSRNQIMAKASFDVIFGGHLFVLDPLGSKTTASAWDAFTQSRVNNPVIVDAMCFRPLLAPGVIIQEGGREYVNTYVPYYCPVMDGDVAPFLDLLARQFPIEWDRRILLNWFARFAQTPGYKFMWWPVIQGVKGNGKTFLISVLRYIAGQHYTHLPNSHAIARDGLKFNNWITRKLLLGIEEINLAHKRDFLDELKVVVTGEQIATEGKGAEQITSDNAANGIIATNHRHGVPIDDDERRYAVFFMAQQKVEDLARDHMDGDYFPQLIAWFKAGGAAIIAGYLKTYAIEAELDPAGLAHRAPKTSTFNAAVQASLGQAEQEILDAIEEGRPGFAGGFVSSKYLDILLDTIRAKIPRNQRRDMMNRLGYDWHPTLIEGRTNDTVTPDAGKPKLYLKKGHLAFNLTSPALIAKAYSEAQIPKTAANDPVKAFG